MEKIVINTSNRDGGTSEHGWITLDDWCNGEYDLIHVSFMNHIYNINAYNYQLPFSINGVAFVIELSQGFYNRTDLLDALNTNAVAVANDLSFTYNDTTAKITINYAGVGSLVLDWEAELYTIHDIIGWDKITVAAGASNVAPRTINLVPYPLIFFEIKQDTSRVYRGKGQFVASGYIRDVNESTFGGLYMFENESNIKQRIKLAKQTRRIEWRFFDKDNNDIDFNGSNINIIFEAL